LRLRTYSCPARPYCVLPPACLESDCFWLFHRQLGTAIHPHWFILLRPSGALWRNELCPCPKSIDRSEHDRYCAGNLSELL